MQGAGTESNPYLISTPSDLQSINNNLTAYYELANDIDMSGYPFTPIGRTYPFFSGHLNGKGFKVTNLRVVNSSIQYTAFIARTNGGSVRNIGLENIYIESSMDDVGGLIGLNSFSEVISNCYVTGVVKQTNTSKSYTGGLIGRNLGTVENCYVDCTVSGGNSVGGLIGWTIDYSPTYKIKNNYSKSAVSGVSKVGAFIGDQGTSTIYENNFYDSSISSNPVVTGITGKTSSQMQTQSTFTGWDFATVWYMNGYPALRVFAGDIVTPNIGSVSVNSFILPIHTENINYKKSSKGIHTHLNQFIATSKRHTMTLRQVEGYLSNIESTAKRNARTVRSSTAKVTSYISPIGSYENRQSKTVKNLLSHIKQIQSDINVLVPLNMNIPNAYVSTLESINKPFKIENMTQVSYILNPSHVEVKK